MIACRSPVKRHSFRSLFPAAKLRLAANSWLLGCLVLIMNVRTTIAQPPVGVVGPSSSAVWDVNPPLRYFGPDPTEGRYVPGLIGGTGEPQVTEIIPGTDLPWNSLSDPNMTSDDVLWDPYVCPLICRPISDHKSGFFQKLSLSAAWMDRQEQDSFGLTEVETFATFALPAPVREWPLLISPTFNVRFLNGPVAPSLPPRLYETFVDFLWVPRLTDRWILILGVAPSVYSDFEVDHADAFRLTGKALTRYDLVPERLQLLAGILYLNRENIRLLPAGGIYWRPTDDWNLELIFPKPKIARRLLYTGDFEDWIYIGGEFGGNTFSVEREPGVGDKLTLFDMRVYVGLERKRDGGAGRRLEIGYVFARDAEYASGSPGVEAADTVMIRGVVAF